MTPVWLSGGRGRWLLAIYVQPGAARSGVVGEHDGSLKLRIAAPALEGRANEALRALLSQRLGIPRALLRIEHGEGSRRKRLEVRADCDAQDLLRNLAPDP